MYIYTNASDLDVLYIAQDAPVIVTVDALPGEARQADIGIAGGKGEALLFKKGEIICKVKEEDLVKRLLEEIDKLS